MELFIKISQFVVSFSLLILIHEFGHFIFARMFGIRVDKFYLFFNPWFTPFKFKYKGTESGIGWLPFGGYCKIAGMVDESMDTDALSQPPKPDEFRSKPAWQRLLVMVGGVLMNVVLATLIYIGASWKWGQEYLYNPGMTDGNVFNALGQEIGFRNGDRILSVDGIQYEDYGEMVQALLLDAGEPVQVLRGADTLTLTIAEEFMSRMLGEENRDFIFPRTAFIVGKIAKDGTATDSDLRKDDRIVGIDSVRMPYFDEFIAALAAHAGQRVTLAVERDGTLLHIPVAVSPEGKIGVENHGALDLPTRARKYTFAQAVPAGFNRAGREIGKYWKQVRLIFNPRTEAYKSVGGIMSIGNFFPDYWDWQTFWNITAFLSIVLAIMNLIPIPGLDGGHVLFLLWEVITRRKPSEKFLENATVAGFFFIILILLLANGNDIYRFFIK
ncbi:MAG: RIP metalloprotease RseP [Rikenellaceae bacterium]|jgi:regulator of sigma E protease|nr:RIP metalloprotease RseP [Rikenellaceae bacterium]